MASCVCLWRLLPWELSKRWVWCSMSMSRREHPREDRIVSSMRSLRQFGLDEVKRLFYWLKWDGSTILTLTKITIRNTTRSKKNSKDIIHSPKNFVIYNKFYILILVHLYKVVIFYLDTRSPRQWTWWRNLNRIKLQIHYNWDTRLSVGTLMEVKCLLKVTGSTVNR